MESYAYKIFLPLHSLELHIYLPAQKKKEQKHNKLRNK